MKNFYELTNPQKSIWLTEQFYSGTSVNNICGTLLIREKVNFSKLEESIHSFVKENDAFRLNFFYENNEIKQQVLSTLDFDIPIIDVSDDVGLLSLENQIVDTPFDIKKSLFNFTMFRFSDGTGGFVICMHHLISDACTSSLVASKIINTYASLLNNEEVIKSPSSYIDYINSENNYLISNKFQKDKEYWNNVLETVPEIGTIPSIKQQNNESCRAERKNFILSKEQVENINIFCSKNKISAFNFFMALYAIYIGKVSGLDDFVLGTPILNRSTFVEKNTPGMFISTVPFRFIITDSLSFTDFTKKIASDSLGMFRHQKYPYQNILEDIRKKNPSQPNLFDILISYQNTKTNRNTATIPYDVRWTFNHNLADSMQIHLFDMNDEGLLNISYDYRLDKYNEEDICAIHDRICYMIEQVLSCNDLNLNDIEIVTPKERDIILNVFNNSYLEYDKTKTVIDYFEQQVKNTPDRIALVCEEKEFTYKTLNEEANKLAHYLIQNNVKHKDIVGIMVHRSPEMIIGLLSILKVGACYLPIDPEYPTDRVSYMLQDSNCSTVLVHSNTFNLINDTYNKIDISLNSDAYNSNEIENLNINIFPDDLIYMIYTSGSTGNPKGVMLTHQNINNFIIAEKQHIDFSQNKVMLSVTTICFDIFALEIWCSLTSGMKVVLANDLEQMTPNLIRKLCNKYNVNMIQTTPSRFSTLLKNKYKLDFFNKFTDIMVGGEAFPQTLLENLRKNSKANIFNMYGPTETTVWSTIKDLTHTSNITIGKPIANTTCYILDKNKHLLPPYVAGELYIGGDGVSNGYWNRTSLTNEKFIKSPFKENEIIYNTNDLAYYTNSGEIVHLGRTDFQVKIRGYRIELEGIENKIMKFNDILDCVVLPVDNATRLCAYYISEKDINIVDLRNTLSQQLPNYMVPNYFVKMENFPYTPNGKINKKALPLPELSTDKKIVPPRNDFDEYIILKLQTYIGIENVSITDSFFDIGGDSLTAINLSTKLSNKYHINFSVRDILETPIIKDMSDSVSSKITSNFNIPLTKAKPKEYYKTSSAQKRLYYISKLSGEDSISYNMPGSIIFDAKPDINKLKECFNVLIKRHSSLRTYFDIIDGDVYQKVLDDVCFEIPERTEKNKTIDEIMTEFIRPFDLAKAPLLRVELVYLDDKVILLFDMHHIISDGLSLSIFSAELCRLYNGDSLLENIIQYTDFAEWEYKNFKENSMRESKAFWINQFSDNIPVLNLPTDYIRPSMQSFEGSKVYKTISSDLAERISSLAKKLDVSNYMFFLSCYYVLLSKYTNQEDIVIGSPVIGRHKEELLNMIGVFVNSLPLKNHIDSSMSFYEFLKIVKTNFITSLMHQSYPFDELVNNLNITRDTSRNPLFDTMFTYQSPGLPPLNFNGVTANYYIPDSNISKFDLSLEVVPMGTEFGLNFEYCTKLFNKSTVQRFSEHFIHILEQIVDNYDLKISDIDILSNDEKDKILREFNNTKMDYPNDKTIIQLFKEQVHKNPDNIAVILDNESITYRELDEKSNNLALNLMNNNIKETDVVGVFLPRSIELIVSIIAILKCNAIYMPLYIGYPDDRINYMIENSNTKVVITNDKLKNRVNSVSTITLNDFKEIHNLEIADMKLGLPDDIAYIIYTSGSTGKPKGVQITNNCLNNFVHSFNKYFEDISSKDKFLSSTNISFDVSIFELFLPLLNGSTLVLYHDELIKDILDYCDYIAQHEITTLYIPPNILNEVYSILKDKQNIKINKLLVGVEAIKKETLDKYFILNPNMRIINGYGPTETTICSTALAYEKNSSFDTDIIPIGKPLYNTNIYILDDNKNIQPLGVTGELYISGSGVGAGYINNIDETSKNYLPNIFDNSSEKMYKTGDIGKWNVDGTITLIGRKDNQIKISGYRIELKEIDSVIMSYPNIDKSTTIVLDVGGKKRIISYFISSNKILEQDVLSYLSKKLAFYMIPAKLIQLKAFPITSNGKIDKKALPIPSFDSETEYIAPENITQARLFDIWCDLFNLDKISITENFFNIGGDSLLSIKLVSRIYDEFNIKVGINEIFNNPTIKDLALVIDSLSESNNKITISKYSEREFYPSSSAQKRMFLASKMDNNSTLYNICGGLLLDTMPDVSKLQNILNTIVSRHDALRTYFEVIDGNIVQKIVEHLKVEINIEKVNTNNIDELFTKYQSVFDLSKAPLFKVFLLILPNNTVLLMLDVHHIIFDGASLNNLMQEISTLYNGKTLPKLAISYKDFAIWEEEQLLNNTFKENKDFWTAQFADNIPILNMPTTYARPANKSYEGNTFVKTFSKDFTEKINTISSKYNVTPYMLMLCAYYVLLYKYTNQDDIVVGSPISGRPYSELENLLGMFVNSIPLKASISSSEKFEDLLIHIKDICVNAFANQNYPFDVLVNDLNIPRDTSRNPLFDTMFIYQNDGYNKLSLDGIDATICAPTSHTSKFDISVEVVPVQEELKLSFEYCLALFNEDFINSFAKHYENILISILEKPDIKICDISILDEEEKNTVMYKFNDTYLEYDKSKTVIDYFEEQVNKTPDNIALVFGDNCLTYKELNEKANQLAYYLVNNGVKSGDSIGILIHRSLEMIIALIATLKVGASYTPLDPEYPIDRINYILKDGNTKTLLVNSSTLDILSDESYLKINVDMNSDIFSSNKLDNLNINICPDNLIYTIYTSGSTGNPKGVMVTHKNINNFIVAEKELINFVEDKVMLSVTTICFDIFALEIWCSLTSGMKLVLASDIEQISPNLLRDLCLKNNVNMIQTTPSRFSAILLGCESLDFFNNFTDIMVGGEPFPKTLLEKLKLYSKANIFNMYGPTETTVWSTIKDLTNTSTITVGKPIANTTCYILDKDKNLLPPYIPGELYIGGDGVTKGYWKREELTNEKFINSPFIPNDIIYNTNDLAYYTKDGEIVHLGRTDFQVKIRGYRIELEEIENCILKYPNIEKCIITADTDANNRQFLVAYLSVNDRISINNLRVFLKGMLPKYMVPSYFMILDKIPYLNNGKVNKKALPKVQLGNLNSESSSYIAPRNKLELKIADIFHNLLAISPIGIDDNFFELGGDSLLAVNLQVELLKLNLNITYSDIFMKPTIRELAKKVSSNETSTYTDIDTSEFLGFNNILDNTCNLPKNIDSTNLGNVLITGTTGFLGAHVLDNFLKTEKGVAYCLVRPEPGLTLENKLLKKLHFYFGNKYDNYIGNRIIIVNSDISENNMGLSNEKMESIANNISCVINCAAKVSHFGDYNIYKKINVDGCENLLKFCTKFNKRFYHISTLSVSGNSFAEQSYIEQSFEHDVIFRENNFYINQSLDNVYVRSKFEAEKLVLQYILNGTNAYILRVGNLMSRYEDGKFQQNVDENAYLGRLISLANIGCIPDYMLNAYMEFTPIDTCADAIIKIAKHSNDTNRIFHLYNHNHVDVDKFIEILRKYISFDIVSNDEFLNRFDNIFNQENSDKLLSGILRDFDANKKLVYESKVKLKSDFTIEYLSKIGFVWPTITEKYLTQFLDYFCSIGYIKREGLN